MQQGVIMVDPRVIQIMQQQVGDAEHIRELLFLNAIDGIAEGCLVLCGLNLLVQLLQPADQKATSAAGKVGHLLPHLGPASSGP